MKVLLNICYKGIYSIIYLFGKLPASFLYSLSSILYFCLYNLVGYRKSVVIQNIARSFPEKRYAEVRDTAKGFYRFFSLFFIELFRLISISTKEMDRKVTVKGFEFVEDQIAQGKSVIACLGHCGNWEMLNYLPAKTSFTVYSGYRPLSTKIMDKLMYTIRTRFGVRLIPSKSIAKHILSHRNQPALYMLIGDQCPKVDTKFQLTFLNQPTSVHLGTEKLARSTNSAVIYIHISSSDDRTCTLECVPICENAKDTTEMEITEKYIRLLEHNINESPSEWLWTHKRWKR